MAALTHTAFLAQLRRKASRPPGVVVIAGDELLFRDQALAGLVAAFYGEDAATSEPVVLRGPLTTRDEPLPLASVLDELHTAPLFGGSSKMVVVRQADAFVKEHAAALVKELARVPAHGALALVFDGGSSVPKAIDKAFTVVTASKPYDTPPPQLRGVPGAETKSPMVRWVVEQAAAEGKKLSPVVAAHLVATVGGSCGRLASEIEKLALYVAERGEIIREDVSVLCGASRAETSFAFIDAVMERDARRALELLERILANGLIAGVSGDVVREPVGIASILLTMLRSRLFDVASVVELMRRGQSPDGAAAALKLAPFVKRRVAGEAGRFRDADLALLFRALLDADAGLKGEEDSPEFVLERLVLGLTGAAHVPRMQRVE